MTNRDPFLSTLLAQAASRRLLGVASIIAGLWLAILWAVSLP